MWPVARGGGVSEEGRERGELMVIKGGGGQLTDSNCRDFSGGEFIRVL